ncbi:MAG: 50S ribosomal protein L3 [Patescibacteria group bacterium]|nr:50S ribosomal protein L3 [Patescibacteria group bacterium]
MKFIFGEKIGMSQIWKGNKVEPITLIEAGPSKITQIKTKESDGYEAVQIGFKSISKKNRLKKTMKGKEFKHLREFRVADGLKDFKIGDEINVSIFKEGDNINISSISKGKGFQGAVKKWGFHGKSASHGVKHEHRTLGSVGSAFPQRVFRGKKMPGRMGSEKMTIKNLKVMKIDLENNLLAVKGAIPGGKKTLVEIRG